MFDLSYHQKVNHLTNLVKSEAKVFEGDSFLMQFESETYILSSNAGIFEPRQTFVDLAFSKL